MSKEKFSGLNKQQVQKQIELGNTNNFTASTSNSNWDIFKRNVFTPFNFLNFAIAVALALVGAWTNMVFIAVIAVNAITGILTEIRAKKMIDKLNLLSKEKVTVLRSGRKQQINPEEIVLGDILELSAGEQIPSDAIVIKGMAEANEAMLTGESDLVLKELDAEVLSGSFLASGKILARVHKVGADNYANKLMVEAKTLKPINSQILFSLNKIAGFTSKIIIPLGLALFFEAWLIYFAKHTPHKGSEIKNAVIYTAAPLLGMLPKGIALLTITSLLTAVIKLGLRKVLVQEMYSVETLARVDTLCLDKTGTITEGKMKVAGFYNLSKKFSEDDTEKIIAAYMSFSEDNNPTAQAIRKKFSKTSHDFEASNIIPFSSDRKWGAMEISGVGTIILGAPEFIFSKLPKEAIEAQSRGSRVLAVAVSSSKIDSHKISLPSKISKLALLEILDPIRDGARETLEYLRSQQVDLKIISGDNPVTVSFIAKEAGFDNFENFVDCSKISDKELQKIATKTAIFGRVSPHQKKLLVQTLKNAGRTVAMTGDGVNDILALREADCSIVMAEGDPATRQIANLVLLNSDFNDMPEILFEGRRVVNNISRIAPIFFIKTIYSFILAIICMISILFGGDALMIFPFIPVQITLVDQIIEGFPPFVLTFEKNDKPVEKNFLRSSLLAALPSALMVVFSVIFIRIFGSQNGWTSEAISTTQYYLLGVIGFFSVVRASLPLNLWRSLLLIWTIFAFTATAIFFRPLLEIGLLTSQTFPIFAVLSSIFALIFLATNLNLGKIRDKIKA
ncbi:MAG: cation-translocating P-type ATPase [bacterium]|nr:cation-translocating P-type ATPase [bacterium]